MDDDDVYQYSLLIAQQEEMERLEREKVEKNELETVIEISRAEHNNRIASEDSALALHLQLCEEDQYASAMNAAIARAASEWREERNRERNQGAWDCQACTFTNRPYESKCRACDSSPPKGVLTFRSLPRIKFGLEIEIVVVHGRRDGFTFESIAKHLDDLGPPSVNYHGYTHQTTTYWKIVTDSSIQGENADDDLCFELVSPVLEGEGGLEELRAIMDNIRRLGIATNASCGFHVHVDAEKSSPINSFVSIKRIAQCFHALENAFDLLVSLSWGTDSSDGNRRANANRYCRSNRLAFGEKSNRQRWNALEDTRSRKDIVQLMNPGKDRYRKLNLTNLVSDRPSTIEFRNHGGVEDIQEAEAWVRLVLSFCNNASAEDENYRACLLREKSSTRDELERLFDLLDCAGLEQFFSIERRLFQPRRLANDWTCQVCSRCFKTSRDLSQHQAARGH